MCPCLRIAHLPLGAGMGIGAWIPPKKCHRVHSASVGDMRAARAVMRHQFKSGTLLVNMDFLAPVLHLDFNERCNALPVALTGLDGCQRDLRPSCN